MSSDITPGVSVTEKNNEDGSRTITTITVHEDGSKTTKRKTIRSKKKPQIPPSATSTTSTEAGETLDDVMDAALAVRADDRAHKDDAKFEMAVRRCIPSEFVLIASQDDLSKAQEAYHAASLFNLPNTKGEAGSLATSALLNVLYKHPEVAVAADSGKKPMNCLELLREVHLRMRKATNFVINPQISASRPLGPPRLKNHAPFHIVPAGYNGMKRALLIGVCFMDDAPNQRLKGPHNDAHNVRQFLSKQCGFEEENIEILADDGKHTAPTKHNILDRFKTMTETAQAGDVIFILYSGHGGRVEDKSGDEADGYDSFILPSDYKIAGHILDDDILLDLIKAMPEGVYTTFLVDCCNSGTVGDLPYVVKANTLGDQEIERKLSSFFYQALAVITIF